MQFEPAHAFCKSPQAHFPNQTGVLEAKETREDREPLMPAVAQETVKWQPRGLAGSVPKRDVNGADCKDRQRTPLSDRIITQEIACDGRYVAYLAANDFAVR